MARPAKPEYVKTNDCGRSAHLWHVPLLKSDPETMWCTRCGKQRRRGKKRPK